MAYIEDHVIHFFVISGPTVSLERMKFGTLNFGIQIDYGVF